MPIQLFEGSEHTSLYAKYRFSISENLIAPTIDYLSQSISNPFGTVVDIGCGSGQAACILSKHFKKYIGVDISVNQIKEANNAANKPKNAEYFVGPCEDMSFIQPNSVDLLTSVQSYHWFDHSRMKSEADRILKPGGVLSVLSYTKLYFGLASADDEVNDKLKTIIADFHNELNDYCNPANLSLFNKHEDVTFPFDEIERNENLYTVEKSFSFFMGFLRTISAYQIILDLDKQRAEDLMESCKNRCKLAAGKYWGGEEMIVTIYFPSFNILNRKPKM